MKTLYVTHNDINDSLYGGAKASKKNYESLKMLGEVDMLYVDRKSSLRSLLGLLEGFYPPSDRARCKVLQDKIKKNDYDIVFFDGSYFGKMAVKAKKKCKVVVFFNNCEFDYIEVRFANNSIKKKLYKKRVYEQECMCTMLADVNIVLSTRDEYRIKEVYDANNIKIVPVCLPDTAKDEPKTENSEYCLLFGPDLAANVEGYEWFIKEVSGKINCKTLVAGKGMDKYKEAWTSDKVEVIGYVDSLQDVYDKAKLVAIPLLSGAGMKIKTAEAMMYGKYIFGTDEAFVGYSMDYDRIGGLCNTADEYVAKINAFLEGREEFYNKYSREVYKDNYSQEVGMKAFRDAIEYALPEREKEE